MSKDDRRHIVRDALFLDIPYIVDSFLRHADYRINGLHRLQRGAEPQIRSYLARPAFGLLLIVLAFAAYGPTFSALCGLFNAYWIESVQRVLGWICVSLAALQLIVSVVFFRSRITRRFDKRRLPRDARWWVVHAVFAVVLFGWATPLYFLGNSVLDGIGRDGCRHLGQQGASLVQLTALALAAAFTAWRSLRAGSLRGRTAWQVLAIAALVALVSTLPVDGAKAEAAQVPYAHVFGFVAVGLALVAWLATWLIHIPFRSVTARERIAARCALRACELFPQSRDDPELSARRIFGGLVTGVLQKPMQFLLLPSFAVLLVPERLLWHATVAGTVASALFITASTLTARWDRMAQYLKRYLLIGIPLVASALVIVVAALRLSGVQYVTTLLNVAPFGVLFMWIVMAYVLGWWFEYQVNSVLAARLLQILGAEGDWDHRLVAYKLDLARKREVSRVDRDHRYITGHGMGQLVVVGQMLEHSSGHRIPAFHTYPFLELFDTLLGRRRPGVAHEIARRVQLYFALVNLLLVLGFGVLAWHWGRGDRLNTVEPVVRASLGPPSAPAGASRPADLAALLAQDENGSKPSALVVSASGGGTRAALYAATVLEGLHKVGADSRVVLLSGVSGGGVASAYFYGYRDILLQDRDWRCEVTDEKDKNPWDCYLDRMAMPFIDDVMRGASEWRIQSAQPLGVLLAESFERRLFTRDAKPLRLGQDPGVGLVLNTTITGHPTQDASMLVGTLAPLPAASTLQCQQRERPTSALAGGRLAFSNLRDIGAFAKADEDLPAIRMPFVVVRGLDDVGLAQAAALNANFPPVFPNARVDLSGFAAADGSAACDVRSYFVTDGGATENLGLLSALLALDSALDSMKTVRSRDIDIVLAEASATDFDYLQDRGVGAATGDAKERLTGRLTLELLDRLRKRVAPAVVRVHDLSLPRVFRSRGGFGTHWAFPGAVRVENPLLTPMPQPWVRVVAQYSGLDRHWATLNRKQLFALWRALYAKEEPFCERKSWPGDPDNPDDPRYVDDLTVVSRWICGHDATNERVVRQDPQPARWEALKKQLVRPPGR